jgi:hypothetical protein
MSDTGPLDPYQPQSDEEEWDDEGRTPGPRVLWGRITILGLLLILAFMLGRASAPSGISQSAYDRVVRQNRGLTAQVDALETAAGQPVVEESPSPSPKASASSSPASKPARSYIVKKGDTLRGIAHKFYGDSSLDDYIAQANGITDPKQLRSGDTLVIPPKP